MKIDLKKASAAGVLCALLLLAPAPAAARVTVTVEVVYGGAVGCLAIFVYFIGSWEVPFASRGLQGALLEIREGQAHLGIPVPSLGLVSDPSGEQASRDTLGIDLLRWRF